MTRPFTAAAPGPVLFVSLQGCPRRLAGSFGSMTRLGTEKVPLIKHEARVLHFCRLADYKNAPIP